MSWASKEFIQNQLWTQFHFFFSNGANGKITESVIPGTDFTAKPWKLTELRTHNSVAFVSVEYIVLRVSSVKGSAYNTVLLSQLYSDVIDLRFTPANSIPMQFLSGDQLVIELSTVSGTNVIGMEVLGWAALG